MGDIMLKDCITEKTKMMITNVDGLPELKKDNYVAMRQYHSFNIQN